MTLAERKTAFVELGKFLGQFSAESTTPKEGVKNNDLFFDNFSNLIELSQSHNNWFTKDEVYFALQSWTDALTPDNLDKWLNNYNLDNIEPKTIGLVLAGNIPLVGFHDLISVLITGHSALIKTSSNDQHLLPFLAKYLIAVEPRFENTVTFIEQKLEGFDAVIATGSNNTARYFEYYFKNKPSIIRKNRNSAAILTGNESKEELVRLGEDIFRYFGLGCRNVSKLFVPKDYDFTPFWEAIYEYRDIIQYEKYANNYDYNKAVFLMSNFKILDNGFLTIKEDSGYPSPISSVFYEFYESTDAIKQRIETDKELIQCIVTNIDSINGKVAFGDTQKPQLWDYADGVDTIAFLSKI
ncbi:acyl-CoA reductase [Flavobacterium sp.]|uniref:acyl-CoA reductase n=1 Tax=Flavobacterium sp. TaxID=239 RepID=UPI003A914BDF